MISDEQYLQFSPYFAQEDIEKEEDRLKFLQFLGVLPQAVRELLISTETTEKIIKIGEKFGLDEFDVEALSVVVRKLATGEVSIVQGVDLIKNEVSVSEEKASDVLGSIMNEVLSPTVEGIKNVQKERFPDRQNQMTIPTQQTPRTQDKPDLKIDPGINKNNVVDLRNRQN